VAAGIRDGWHQDGSAARLIVLQLAVDTLAATALYALIALAVSLSYSGSGILNLAVGQIAVAGGLAAAAVSTAGWSVWVGVLIGIAVAAALGAVAERTLVKPSIGRPVLGAALLIAAAIVLREVLIGLFPRTAYAFPVVGGTFRVLGGIVHTADLVTIGVVAAVAAAGAAILRTTTIGAALRLTAASPGSAELLGVDTQLVRTASFAVGGALAAGAVLLGVGHFPIAAGGGVVLAFRGIAASVAGGVRSPQRVLLCALAIAAGQVIGGFYLGSGGEFVSDVVAVGLIALSGLTWRR
jgi:branched-chain amino acid transport system permease protein